MSTPSSVAQPSIIGSAVGLSGWEASTALARLSLKRIARGKALWVALASALVTTIYAIAHRANGSNPLQAWEGAFAFSSLLLVIVPPILVTSSIADEIDDKTSAYLWSRALPRWSVITGKLLGLAPIVAITLLLSLTMQWLILGAGAIPGDVFARGALGLAGGAVAASAIAAMLATLFPRFAVAIAVGWMLLDTTVGALDMKLNVIAAAFGTRAIAGFADEGDAIAGAISLAVLTAIALAVSIRRIGRLE